MRVSQYFHLGRAQATLDFVDVDVEADTPVFISPRALTLVPSDWGDYCVHLVQDFFDTVLRLIKAKQHGEAEALLSTLREPNETHLGLSHGKSRGRALGEGSAHDVWGALSTSVAAATGLITDLEDTILLIEGIDVDIISDITTNIIREPLIAYTQEMASWYGIPLPHGVASGPIWDGETHAWKNGFVDLPMANGAKLLLVPKAIVRTSQIYDVEEYYRHYLLEHMKSAELAANSQLVQVLKDGRRKVTKKSLMEKYGAGKKAVIRETLKHPQVLAAYKKVKEDKPHLPLDQEDFSDLESVAQPDWDALLSAVISVPVGAEGADSYEKAVEALITALFYPDLMFPKPQHQIHGGRKRIDITYTNLATGSFFHWVAGHYPAAHLFVECKNYGNEVGNPELDQLSGRFSPSRGKVGRYSYVETFRISNFFSPVAETLR